MTDALTRLHTFIVAHYSLEELQTLSFELGVPYDDLTGEGRSGQARELILHLGRRQRLGDLLDRLERDQPALYAQADLGRDLPLLEASFSDAVFGDGAEDGGPDQSQVGGIRAGRIEADNVVVGVQQLGGDLSETAGAVALAEALGQGTISAGSIQALNVVAGLQYIADPAQATPDELRQEVAALRQ